MASVVSVMSLLTLCFVSTFRPFTARYISLLQPFTASKLPVLKVFVTDGQKYTGKVVLAFITSAQKQEPEGIAVAKQDKFIFEKLQH